MRLELVKRSVVLGFAIGLLTTAGCAGSDAGRGGTIVIATAQDPDGLFPPTHQSSTSLAITDLLFGHLADRGPGLNTVGDSGFVPRLARSWEWSRDSLRVTFHLDPRARWHDGVPVRAADVRFAFQVYTDTLVAARSGGDLKEALDSIAVADSLTCVAWFKGRTPEQFNTLVMSLTPLPEHLLGRIPHDSLGMSPFTRSPVGNGPFRFVRWDARQRVEIAATDPFYRPRPQLDRVIWAISPQQATTAQQLFAGEADFVENLTVEDAAAAAKRLELQVLQRGGFEYQFLQFNLFDGASDRRNPLFAERDMRRALTMALDRTAMVRSRFGSVGRVGLGPFTRAQWSSDTTLAQIPFDRAAAARTLDSLGWRAGSDGVRARNGRPLAFRLLVPTSSANRQALAVLVQAQLRQVGVKVDLDPVDYNAMQDRVKARRFEAAFSALAPTPSPSGIRQSWTIIAAREGGFNSGRYLNPTLDAEVDSAVSAGSVRVARAHYRAAYQIAIGDAPAIWMFEPPLISGANQRLRTGPLRPDGWWLGIPDWSISPGTRLPRDTAAPKSP